MQITSVEKNKKNKDRLSIYVDGEYRFSISEEAFLGMNFYDKKEISNEEIEHIIFDENFRVAKASSIRYLSLKLHSEGEVFKKLETEGFDNDTIKRVIDELMSLGYINDKIYVQKFIYDREKLKPKSKRFIKLELLAKGISEYIIDEILNDWDVDEKAVAYNLVKKKFGKYNINDEKVIKKIYSFLNHRGYIFEVIESVIYNIKKGKEQPFND